MEPPTRVWEIPSLSVLVTSLLAMSERHDGDDLIAGLPDDPTPEYMGHLTINDWIVLEERIDDLTPRQREAFEAAREAHKRKVAEALGPTFTKLNATLGQLAKAYPVLPSAAAHKAAENARRATEGWARQSADMQSAARQLERSVYDAKRAELDRQRAVVTALEDMRDILVGQASAGRDAERIQHAILGVSVLALGVTVLFGLWAATGSWAVVLVAGALCAAATLPVLRAVGLLGRKNSEG